MNYFKNLFSTSIFIIIFLFYFKTNNYLSSNLDVTLNFKLLDFSIIVNDFIFKFFIVYLIFLIPFYLIETWTSKARIIIKFIINKIKDINYKINFEEKNAILAWLVKIFFWPLMLKYLINWLNSISNNINNIILNINNYSFDFIHNILNNSIFPTIIWIIFFIDVLFFAFWYLLEAKIFKNQIKSVEPTFFWWWIALICYEPFNFAISNLFWNYHNNYVYFWDNYINIFINIIIIILLWIYAWASYSLGLKASNLTNRWIIKTWPYKYIRHPAYVCKNLVWWISWLWLIYNNLLIENNFKIAILIFFSLSIWSYIYYLRAITEEKHLSLDIDYLEYKKQVKNRFFPTFKK